MIKNRTLRRLKRSLARILGRSPIVFSTASKILWKLDRSFDSLSVGAPGAITAVFERLKAAGGVPAGHYYEFGLFRGYTLHHAEKTARKLQFDAMSFHGFDSFQGLPVVEGIDRMGQQFFEGQFACSKEGVTANLRRHGTDLSRVTLTEGFFCDSLTEELKRRSDFARAAVAFIDCDLYSSTRDVLAWLESLLQDGSMLLFDDWFAFGGAKELGQQKAFAEFQAQHPAWAVDHLFDFEPDGRVFRLRRTQG
jgi:O-methyltransferase